MHSFDLINILFILIPMILALTVHEYAHAGVAYLLGDTTAARIGRLTLNPLSHIDLIGSLLIPAVGIASGVPFFGWAKPVPITPVNFTRKLSMKTASLWVSAAGPLANLLFAAVLAILLGFIGPLCANDILRGETGLLVSIVRLAGWTMLINIGLFIFNLLPIPPLDGSHVLEGILSARYQHILDFLNKWSFVLFILILMGGGRFISPVVSVIITGFSKLVGFPLMIALYGT